MPITVTRDDANRRFTAVAEGVLTPDEIRGFMAEHRVGPYRRYGLLFDIRSAELLVSPAAVRGFADARDPLLETDGPRGPVAILVTEPSVYGLVRMYETLAELRNLQPIRGFHALEDAIAWLESMASSSRPVQGAEE
jgi:hypothetical protein